SFYLNVASILRVAAVLVGASILVTILIFYITPIGGLYQHQQEGQLRSDVIQISEQMMALRDSLFAREQQLSDMKYILMNTPDTTFSTDYSGPEPFFQESFGRSVGDGYSGPRSFDMMSENEIIHSEILKNAPEFPAPYPVDGELSQEYNLAEEHFGIDIAARPGSIFTSIADGTVLNAGWTITYGYVIYVQHGNGFMSVYKHGSSLLKKKGDIVLKGDILGSIGDSGVLSYGSHLHLEIWKDGVAQNPLMYVIK
ncbi:MAG: M23 family metallopeptidase, partial [Balneolaceae bacterium]